MWDVWTPDSLPAALKMEIKKVGIYLGRWVTTLLPFTYTISLGMGLLDCKSVTKNVKKS